MKRTAQERADFVAGAAARMVASPTPAEARLWEVLRPLGFKRQVPILVFTKNNGACDYILDFYHEKLKLCVEADGGIHKRSVGRDRRRDTRLAREGIRTMRFTNVQVIRQLDLVLACIRTEMEDLRERA